MGGDGDDAGVGQLGRGLQSRLGGPSAKAQAGLRGAERPGHGAQLVGGAGQGAERGAQGLRVGQSTLGAGALQRRVAIAHEGPALVGGPPAGRRGPQAGHRGQGRQRVAVGQPAGLGQSGGPGAWIAGRQHCQRQAGQRAGTGDIKPVDARQRRLQRRDQVTVDAEGDLTVEGRLALARGRPAAGAGAVIHLAAEGADATFQVGLALGDAVPGRAVARDGEDMHVLAGGDDQQQALAGPQARLHLGDG